MFPFQKDVQNFLHNVLARSVGNPARPYEDNTAGETASEPQQPDLRPQNPPQNVDGEMPLEDLLNLAVQAGKVNIYFHNPVITQRFNGAHTHAGEGFFSDPGPCVAGQMVAELRDGEGHIAELVSGQWVVSLLPFCPTDGEPFLNPGMNMREIMEEMQEGRIDSHIVSMPDLLAAAENIDAVDVFFGRKGRIERIRAVADGVEMEGTITST